MAATEITPLTDMLVTQPADGGRGRASTISYRVMLISLVVHCVLGAAIVGFGSARLLGNPWDNSLPEGAHIFAALRAAQTGHIYFPYTQSPYVVQSYGPLFYVVNAIIARASQLDVRSMILNGRLFCYFCYLLCGGFVFAISRRSGSTALLSLLSALMLLGRPDFCFWSVTVRPDAPFLLAMLVSLYLAVRTDDKNWLMPAASGMFGALAFLLKQPGAAVIAAILGVFVWQKNYKRAAVVCTAAAVPVLIMFAVLLWREPYFLDQFTSVGKGCWSLREGVRYLVKMFGTGFDAPVRQVTLFIGVLGFSKAVRQAEARSLLAWFAVANFVLSMSALPQLGSTSNYFLPIWAGCALLLPPAVETVQARATRPIPMLVASALLVWITWIGSVSSRVIASFYEAPKRMSFAELQPYRIISDMDVLALYGHPDVLDNFAVHSLELQGHFSSAPIVKNLHEEHYDLILLTRVNYKHISTYYRGVSEYAPAVVSAMNDNYVVLCSSLWNMVLRPRHRDIALPPAYFSEMFGVPCGTGMAGKSPGLKVKEGAR